MTPLGLLVFQVQGDGRLLWRIFTPAKGSMLCVLAVPAQIPAIVRWRSLVLPDQLSP